MSKIPKIVIISCVTILTLATGVSVYASRAKRFIDKNGNEITVQCNDNLSSNSEDVVLNQDKIIIGPETPQIGDILIVDGVKEKVVALGKDGEFITDIVK